MTSYYDMMRFAKTGIADDLTMMDKVRSTAAFGGGEKKKTLYVYVGTDGKFYEGTDGKGYTSRRKGA